MYTDNSIYVSWEMLERDINAWGILKKLGFSLSDIENNTIAVEFENKPENDEMCRQIISKTLDTLRAYDEIMDKELKQKELECRNNILEHINNVKLAFEKYGEIMCSALNVDIGEVKKLIDIHDQSKLLTEFDLIRTVFFRTKYEGQCDRMSKKYFYLMHHNANPHHAEYWILVENFENISVLDMPSAYIIEMLLDIISFANSDYSIEDLWISHKQEVLMTDSTIDRASIAIGEVLKMEK